MFVMGNYLIRSATLKHNLFALKLPIYLSTFEKVRRQL